MVAFITNLGQVKGFDVVLMKKTEELSQLEQEVLVKELNSITIDAFNKPTPIKETRERTIGVDSYFINWKVQSFMLHFFFE